MLNEFNGPDDYYGPEDLKTGITESSQRLFVKARGRWKLRFPKTIDRKLKEEKNRYRLKVIYATKFEASRAELPAKLGDFAGSMLSVKVFI